MLLALLVLAALGEAKTIIAAVGDSVTAGDHGLPPFANDEEGNYPFFLQGLLDDAYPGQFEVANLGLSGATASDGTNKPYRNSKYWPQLQELAFDLAIVTLGTNDAKLAFWESPDFGVEKFEENYGTLLHDIIAMRPNATILVGYPVPYSCPLGGLKCKGMWGSDTSIINEDLQRATNRVAERVGLIEDVDFFEALGGRSPSPELFHDSIHPNYNGYQVLGQAAFDALLPLVSPTAMPTTATPTRRPTPAPTTPAPSTPAPSHTPTTTTPTTEPSAKPTSKPTVRPTAPSCARVELVDASDCPADLLNLPPCSDALETGQLCLGDDACADASLANCGRRRLLEDDGARKAVYRVVAPAPTARPTSGGGGSKGGGGGDDAGLIAGVVVAVIVALGLGAGAYYYYTKRERTKPAKAELPSWAAEDSKQGDPPPPPPTSPTPLLAFAAPPPPLTSPKSYEERRAMTPSVRNAMMATPSARKSEDLIGLDRPSFAKARSQKDAMAPPVALRSPAPPPPSPFWKRLFGGAAEEEEEAAEPRPSWSRMTPPSSTEEPSSPADIAGAPPLPESPHSPPLEDAILSVIDPPELRPRASRAPTPPPQRQGFGRGPSAAIIASPRNVVIEPVPRVARVTSNEVDELFEATTPQGAPSAAEDEETFNY